MSSATKIEGFTKQLTDIRHAISELPEQTGFTGNAMSSINASLDNLKWQAEHLAKTEKEKAEKDAAELEVARKKVAEADAKVKAEADARIAAAKAAVATPKA